MVRRTKNIPTKNAVRPAPQTDAELARLDHLATTARYIGNPQHKLNPGDFNLTPPACGRTNKNLCDDAGIFKCAEAQALLCQGLREGLIGQEESDGWPCRVWSVDSTGRVFEAKLDAAGQGTYHAYPLAKDDPLASRVLERRVHL